MEKTDQNIHSKNVDNPSDHLHHRKWSVQAADAEALSGLRTVEVGLAVEQIKDTIEIDAAAEKRILRKVDLHLIPLLTLLYL